MSDDRFIIELFAQSPDIVTPTGLGMEAAGRVLMFEDTDGDGRADRRTIFDDGLSMAMDLAVLQPFCLSKGVKVAVRMNANGCCALENLFKCAHACPCNLVQHRDRHSNTRERLSCHGSWQ